MKKLILMLLISFFAAANVLAQSEDKLEMDGWFKAGTTPGFYEIGTAQKQHEGMSVYYIKSTQNVTNGFGTIMKSIDAKDYLTKRIRLSGYIKCENVERHAGMWFRVDGKTMGSMLGFDNMGNRPIEGTKDWQKYEIVLDVPDTSAYLAYGVLLNSNGAVWLSGLQFEEVGNDVAVTNMLSAPYQEPVSTLLPGELPIEIRNIPEGLVVTHSPVDVKASKNKEDTTMFYWFHQTTIKPVNEDIEITEFGTYTWDGSKWAFGNVGGVPFSPKDFAEWYECKNAKLKKNKEYSDKNNWGRWPTLQKASTLWYYIGKNKKGDLFKGTSIVNYLPEMKD